MTLSPQVDRRLQRTETLWKRQFLLRQLAMLGAVALMIFLAIGIAMHFGWFQGFFWPLMLIGTVMLCGLLGSLIIMIWAADKRADPEFLASTVEKIQQPLQDRLNTLVHLQHQTDGVAKAIRPEIEKQTVEVLHQVPETFRFPRRQNVVRLVVLGLLFSATAIFYGYYQPWRQLTTEPPEVDAALEIPAADSAIAKDEPNPLDAEAWTEVRISEPGRDLHVTEFEVVPLTIEAASNRPLDRVEWFSEVNGQSQQQHAIPAPEDPRYVVHQAELLLEDLLLEPWDVLAYFARATTADGQQHDSEMYFIDFLPRHEQLDELPGGEEGKAHQAIRELTDMIQRQQDVLRQTQYVSRPRTGSMSDGQIRHLEALAQEELQLREDIQHLLAMLRSRLRSTTLERLEGPTSQANEALVAAEQRLRERTPSEAVPHERGGLANLIAMRKQFQQLVQDHPELFRQQPLELALADPARPLLNAEQRNQLVEQAARERESLSAATEAVQDLVRQQRDVEQQTSERPRDDHDTIGEQQRRVQKAFSDASQRYANALQHAANAARSAENALQRAVNALQDKDHNANAQDETHETHETHEAREALEQLEKSLENKKHEFELAENLALEQRLRQNIERYEALERDPAQTPTADVEKSVSETKGILEALKDLVARNANTSQSSDDPTQLERQLDAERIAKLNADCDELSQQQGPNERRQLASGIKRQLEDIAKALTADNREQAQQLFAEQQARQTQQMQASEAQLQKARQFVQDTLLKQRDIERAANRRNQPQKQDLVQQQQDLQKSLEDHIQDNPPPFQSLSGQCDKAQSAMRDSAESLQSRREDARAGAREAAKALQQLDDALERQQQRNSLADAQRLQQSLDQQTQQLKQLESQPQPPTPSQCRNAGGQCKSITDQLKQLGDRPGTAGSVGKRLQAALSDETKQRIDAESDALAASKTNGEMQSAAKQLRQSLEEVSSKLGKALTDRGQKSNQGLRPGGQQAIERGFRQLDSLARRQAQQRLTAEAQSQLKNEALHSFSQGITGVYGHNERTQLVLRQLREQLEQPVTVDPETVRELSERVQALRREAVTQETTDADEQQITGIDPTRLPPEYRDSIRKYFQELSRQP